MQQLQQRIRAASQNNNLHLNDLFYAFDRKLKYMCIATREIMDCMFEAYLTHDSNAEVDDIPLDSKEPVYISGKKYIAAEDLSAIRHEITSKIWFTYRRGFVPIGGDDGLTTDRGWGCMLRCGQMVLAHALVRAHLGSDWQWDADCKDPTYLKIIRKFEDNRQAPFSIHQIALMGASEGKDVGQWFGPNTVSQVLKKLIKYDEWSSIVMQVALDNSIVINDIREACGVTSASSTCVIGATSQWKPLLLVIPMRLGLQDINPIYVKSLKKCFQFKQSLGVIGGKPNLALYFIGCIGDEVIYLDPHTTQKTGSVDHKNSEDQVELDVTYHCKRASRMNILSMDPSVAICFFCPTEADFDELCVRIREDLNGAQGQPLLDVCQEKQRQYSPPLDFEEALGAFSTEESLNAAEQFDSEEEFEIIH